MAHYDYFIKTLKEGKYSARVEYRNRIVSLQKTIKGSYLEYRIADNYIFQDLVLYDKNGDELARVCSSNPFSDIYNHFLKFTEY